LAVSDILPVVFVEYRFGSKAPIFFSQRSVESKSHHPILLDSFSDDGELKQWDAKHWICIWIETGLTE